MSKCSVCGNEIIMCSCPKGLAGGDPSHAEENKAYRDKVDQVSTAILEQYAAIHNEDHSQRIAFIDNLQALLDDESSNTLLKRSKNSTISRSDAVAFKDAFKNLSPNMAMLDELSQKLNLGIFPSPANAFEEGIQQSLEKLSGYPLYPESKGENFQQTLQIYAEYYQTLSPEQQDKLSEIFWEHIKILGTPIIESKPDKPDQCEVYFLLPKGKLSKSKEVAGTKKDLYLQGDFHGYDFTKARQRVTELANTGVMFKKNTMPKDAIVTYRYIQLEPGFKDLSASQIHGSDKVELPPKQFFPDKNKLKEKVPTILPTIPEGIEGDSSNILNQSDTNIIDDNTIHRPPYFEANGAERILRINPNSSIAKLGGQQINWATLLSANSTKEENKHFKHHKTLYSSLDGRLHEADPLYREPNAGPSQFFSKNKDSPYANCTRAIHVFEPASGTINNVIIINDGVAYLALDGMSKFEQMAEDDNFSKNTAFICITPLPALLKTIPVDDPKASMPGMGERTVDYEHRIDEYAAFIRDSLLPTLKEGGLDIPADPNSRTMVGSSLSGTASIYIASKYPNVVGTVVAQSPSPSNRNILEKIVEEYQPEKPRAHIELSCGVFEQAGFAENTNLPFAKELEKKLELPLTIEQHGHQHLAWTQELQYSIPSALRAQTVDALDDSHANHELTASDHCVQVTKDCKEKINEMKEEQVDPSLSPDTSKPTSTFGSPK